MARQSVRVERQDRRQTLELPRRRCVFLVRGSEWGSVCRLGRLQRVCAKRQDRSQAVELRHWGLCDVLARGGEWGGVRRLGRQQGVRLRPKVKSEATRWRNKGIFQTAAHWASAPRVQAQGGPSRMHVVALKSEACSDNCRH
jgi:hypothetical protein